MGKDVLGRELGRGIVQAKSGEFIGKYVEFGRTVSKAFPTREVCEQWLEDNRGRKIPMCVLKDPDSLTVDTWLWFYLERIHKPEVRENSYLLYKRLFRLYVRPHIGSVPLRDLRPDMVQQILLMLQQRGSPKGTMKMVRTAVHDAMEKAVERDLLKANPVNRLVIIPREIYRKPARKALSREEQGKVLEYLEGTVYYNPLAFLMLTGLRVGEMTGLMWDDVDWEGGSISIRRTMEKKTGGYWRIGPPKGANGQRVIPINEDSRRILLRQKESDQSLRKVPKRFRDFVFLRRDGFPWDKSALDRYIRKVADALEIEHFSHNTLRNTYAMRCLEEGMNPKSLQILLGHCKIEMTIERYIDVPEEENIDEMFDIEEALDVEND